MRRQPKATADCRRVHRNISSMRKVAKKCAKSPVDACAAKPAIQQARTPSLSACATVRIARGRQARRSRSWSYAGILRIVGSLPELKYIAPCCCSRCAFFGSSQLVSSRVPASMKACSGVTAAAVDRNFKNGAVVEGSIETFHGTGDSGQAVDRNFCPECGLPPSACRGCGQRSAITP